MANKSFELNSKTPNYTLINNCIPKQETPTPPKKTATSTSDFLLNLVRGLNASIHDYGNRLIKNPHIKQMVFTAAEIGERIRIVCEPVTDKIQHIMVKIGIIGVKTLRDLAIYFNQKPFKVTELTTLQRKTAQKVIETWHNLAETKAKQLSRLEGNPFEESRRICLYVSNDMLIDYHRIFICSDRLFNQIQAIAIVTDSTCTGCPSLYLNYLATNPQNIRSTLNDNEIYKVTGAASKLINHLEKVCRKEKRDEINLTSIDSAVGFYQKYGFTQFGRSFKLKVQQNS